jgi:hypothetical protein
MVDAREANLSPESGGKVVNEWKRPKEVYTKEV